MRHGAATIAALNVVAACSGFSTSNGVPRAREPSAASVESGPKYDAVAEPQRPPTYHPRLEFATTAEQDGVEGRVELLEDTRITPPLRSALERWYHGAECDGAITDVCRSVSSYELLPSRLRLVDRHGSELGLRELEEPFAEVEPVHLGPDLRPTYFVTVDMSIGAGAYNGPVTRFAEVSHGVLHWLTAFDGSGHVEEIEVMSSLRTSWRAAPRNDGRGQDILSMRVDVPDSKKQSGWRVTYTRFTFDEGSWHQRSRSAIEQWEETPFPPPSRFP